MAGNKAYMGVPIKMLPEGMYERLCAQESEAHQWFSQNLRSLLRKQIK